MMEFANAWPTPKMEMQVKTYHLKSASGSPFLLCTTVVIWHVCQQNKYKLYKKNNIMNTEKRNLITRKFAILRVRHLVMSRVKWHHYLLIAVVLFPSIAVAYITDSPLQAIAIGVWLVIPCKDEQFGNGKKYYWIRQAIFGLGTIICVLAGVA